MRWTPIGRTLGGVGCALFLVTAFTPLPNLLAGWLVSPPRLAPAEAIVVLGAGVSPQGHLSEPSLQRAIHGMLLQRRGLAPLLVFFGAAGDGGAPEAAVRAALAHELGFSPETILTEARARTTREEAARLATLLQPRGIRRILLVTHALHMPRARVVFERAGFEVLAAPADEGGIHASTPEDRLALMRTLLEELFGRLYYRVAG